MAHKNQLVSWACGVGANIATSPEAYAAMTIRQLGAQVGIGDPVSYNNAQRQSSVVAAMIGQFTADYGPSDVNDDGNIAILEAQFLAALDNLITASVQSITAGQNAFVHYGNADSGTANNYIFTTPTPAVTSYTAGLLLMAKLANGVTGPSVINVAGLGFIPITRGDLTPLKSGDAATNEIAMLLCDGSRFQLLGVLPAVVVATGTNVVTASGAFATPSGITTKMGLLRQSFVGNSSTSLPSAAADGTTVKYADLAGNFQAFPLNVAPPAGNTIAGELGWICNVNRGTWTFTFFANGNTWGVEKS